MGKAKLIALAEDAIVLREIAAALPWYDIVASRDPRQMMGLIDADAESRAIHVVMAEETVANGSGLTLLEALRRARPEVRRIMLTGYSDLGRVIAGLHSGAIQATVQKPVRRIELLAAVNYAGAVPAAPAAIPPATPINALRRQLCA